MTKEDEIMKSKNLLENKKDVDENVENILRIVGEENEPDDSANSFDRSKLSSLIKGFHEEYKYLHKHYKQLIIKLENDGQSSAGLDLPNSDSKGSKPENDAPNQKGDAVKEENDWKQKLVEDHRAEEQRLESDIEKLEQNAVEQAKEISDLKQLLDNAIKDKDSARVELTSQAAILSSENEILKSLIEATEEEASDLLKKLASKEIVTKTLSSEKQIVENERDDLKISLADMENKRDALNNQLKDTVEKCNFLASQLEKAQLTENELQNLLAENQKMKKENSMLSAEYDDLKARVQNVEFECSQLKETIAETRDESQSLIGEKHSLESKLQLLTVETDNLKVEKEEIVNNLNSAKRSAEDEKGRLASELKRCLNELEQAQLSVKELERELKSTKGVLNDEIATLQRQKSNALLELKQSVASLKNLEDELKQQQEQISVLQTTIEDLELVKSNLHNEIAAVQGQKNVAVASIKNLESELEQQTERISILQQVNEDLKLAKTDLLNEFAVLKEEKNAAILRLQESEAYIENLESELEQLNRQISILQLANEELQEKNSILDRQLGEARTNLQAGVIALQDEKEQALEYMQQSKGSIKNLESELEQHKEQMSILQLANDDLQKSNSTLNKQLEEANVSLHAEILTLEEEKNKSLLELQQSQACIKNLRSELDQEKEQISVLNLANEDLKKSNASLDKQFKEARTSLQAAIVAIQEEKDTALSELQRSQAAVNNFESELEQQREKILDLQQVNDDLWKSNGSLTEQFEEVKAGLQREISVTKQQKDAALSQLKQSEASIMNLQSELEEKTEKISILHQANEDLKSKHAILDKQLEETRASLHDEIVALQEEKDTIFSELQQSQLNFEKELDHQREKTSILQQANDDLQKHNAILTKQFEEVKAKLQREILVTKEKEDTALSQLKQSETSIKNLESELGQMEEDILAQWQNNSSLEKQLEEAILEVSSLHEKLEKVQAEMASQISDMSINAKDQEKTIELLSSQKNKAEEDLKSMIGACTENMALMKEFEDTVERKIAYCKTRHVCLQQSLGETLRSCHKLQYAYDEVSTRVSQLEILGRDQAEQIDRLEEKNIRTLDKHRRLEEEKSCADKESAKLHSHVQELEVQLQLAKQKLKVTEAESKCKEDDYKMAMETSQAEIRQLEEQLQKFSGSISLHKENLMRVKGNAESGVSVLVRQLDELKSLFDQRFAHCIEQSFACTGELKLLRRKLQGQLDEKKELVKQNHELASRLGDKEIILSEVTRNATEAEQKIIQLKRTVEEKEEELASRVKEKREAIKHLSDAIVYHKNNSVDLIRHIRSHNCRRLPFCL